MLTKCSCNTCSGHIEFDAAHAGETVTCPHCGLETILFVPAVPLDPPTAPPHLQQGQAPPHSKTSGTPAVNPNLRLALIAARKSAFTLILVRIVAPLSGIESTMGFSSMSFGVSSPSLPQD
jgi:DNA-directed RNA polymerase subunit RPC12/RpoP